MHTAKCMYSCLLCTRHVQVDSIPFLCSVHKSLEEHAAKTDSQMSPADNNSPKDDTQNATADTELDAVKADVVPSMDTLSVDGKQPGLQQSTLQTTAATCMLLSAELLSSSHDPHDLLKDPEADAQQDSTEASSSGCPQVAVTIPLPSEVVVDQNKAWHGR